MTYDVIGDIHGHAKELRMLLGQLGYEEQNGAFAAPNHKAIFVGDFIDRGPAIPEVLNIARSMVARGSAYALLGNHEFNALCYHTPDGAGGFLRAQNTKNRHQHQKTLEQLVDLHPKEWNSYLQWFRDLPLFLEIEGLRVVHASWDPESIRLVRGRSFHDPDFLAAAAKEGKPEFEAVERLLKGPEIALPPGQPFIDKDGNPRERIRTAWWQSSKRKKRLLYKEVAAPSEAAIPEKEVPAEFLSVLPSYSRREPPVIFGHYWLVAKKPKLLEPNAACVDYSVAKGGFLTAYSWAGERELKPERFTFTTPEPPRGQINSED